MNVDNKSGFSVVIEGTDRAEVTQETIIRLRKERIERKSAKCVIIRKKKKKNSLLDTTAI